MSIFICSYCGSNRKNDKSLTQHELRCPSNPNRKYQNGMLGRKGANQFTKARKLGLPIPESKCKGRPGHSRPHSEESKRKLSEHAIKNGLGGITQSRWICYKGKKLGSSYELLVAKSLDENNIRWDTCERIKYIDPNGKKRTYTPDIYIYIFN